ncbi:multicopper oxidase family protein [Kitasatospora sp. NPDC048286]|uniref:multicopper oxidase family protein n=1 Tax=Kitasatospora sp. NPDC048286 TaxID=3364047 RepID=UPI00371CCC4C
MIKDAGPLENSQAADVAENSLPSRRKLLRTTVAAVGAVGFAGALANGHSYAVNSPSGPGALRVGRHHPHPSRPSGGALDPSSVPKYRTPLFLLGEMPSEGRDSYRIAIRQFRQQMLPSGMPATTVWGYGAVGHQQSFHTPGLTIEARVDRPISVTWVNDLVTSRGLYLPHLCAVDPTLHWANPPGGRAGRDSRPTFSTTPGPYTGPVPIVTHLHGGYSREESDGYPEAWYLPASRDIPRGYARVGTYYDRFAEQFRDRCGVRWRPGSATFAYDNDQRPAAFWYHDHTLGMTRVNVYAGLAGFYLLRGGPADLPSGVLPGPAPGQGGAHGAHPYEIPLVVQDKSFNTDGSIFFPSSRGYFGDTPPDGPWIPDTDIPPIWNPEFFGTTMVVNGNTWPVLDVEPRRYRLRILNASNARTLILKIAADATAPRPVSPALPFWQIGNDQGFLPAPVQSDRLLLAPAERADVVVDFTGTPVGTGLYLINEGPDEAYGGGAPVTDFTPADITTTGQVMKFTVVPLTSTDTSVPPSRIVLPPIPALPESRTVRKLSLNEEDSAYFTGAPTMATLGTVTPSGSATPLLWSDPVTETPVKDDTEIWELYNFTPDAHPVHIHQIGFQVLDRQAITGGELSPPQPGEGGYKDTVIALPGNITRVKVRFGIAGRYVWHCHIIDHEDNEMMRPLQVLDQSGR